jgi:Zn-dependent protease
MGRLNIPFRMQDRGWVVLLYCASIGIALDGWRRGPILGFLLLASLFVHEFGHMLMATRLGVPVREFGLSMTGAYIRRAYAKRRRDEILIAAAGPLTNLLIAIPLLFMHITGVQLALANVALGVINLLPIPASDGMRILKTIMNPGAPGPVLAQPVGAIPVLSPVAISPLRNASRIQPALQLGPQTRV